MKLKPGNNAAILIFSLALAGCRSEVSPTSRDWPVYWGDPHGTKYSDLTQIHKGNVHRLQPAWIYRTGDKTERPASTIQCNPLVREGVMYLTTASLKVVALRADSGEKIWEFDPGTGERGVNRGLTFWQAGPDRRVFHTAGPFLYALDPATGEPVRSFGDGGKVDLREDLDQDAFFLSVTSTSPGIVYGDLLIMGSAVGEGPGPAAPGHIRAYDVRTGERRWIFHTIPHPGEPGHETWPPDAWKTAGGANAWGGLTLDPARGLVFCGTGSPAYDHYGGDRTGQNLYGNCVLALEAQTGKLRWYFQAVHHDLWDYDLPCPPTLVTVERDGRRIDAVAQPTKMGHLFVLDRETGAPLFPVEERPVPASKIPGESTWPTQPFPLKPPPYAQQRFTEREVTDLNDRARAAVAERLRSMHTGDVFLPPDFEPSVALPQFNGGTDWGGAAVDPRSRVLYVNASNEAEWISMVPARPRLGMRLRELGSRLYRSSCSNCHGFNVTVAPDSKQAASLKDLGVRLSRADLMELLETGSGQMPSFSHLAPIEKRALASFLLEEEGDKRLEARDLRGLSADRIPFVATGHNEFKDPENFPVNQRPWGTLNAIDLDRGEILWQVALGTYPQLEARGYPPTGTFNMGGPIVTGGGLVFIAASMDERFRAFDSRTGRVLWEYQMEAGGYATPATFMADGRQYVVIAAGGGGKPETKPGDAYYCFALPRE